MITMRSKDIVEEKIPFIKFKNSFYSGQLEVGTLMLGCRMDAYRQSNRGYFLPWGF